MTNQTCAISTGSINNSFKGTTTKSEITGQITNSTNHTCCLIFRLQGTGILTIFNSQIIYDNRSISTNNTNDTATGLCVGINVHRYGTISNFNVDRLGGGIIDSTKNTASCIAAACTVGGSLNLAGYGTISNLNVCIATIYVSGNTTNKALTCFKYSVNGRVRNSELTGSLKITTKATTTSPSSHSAFKGTFINGCIFSSQLTKESARIGGFFCSLNLCFHFSIGYIMGTLSRRSIADKTANKGTISRDSALDITRNQTICNRHGFFGIQISNQTADSRATCINSGIHFTISQINHSGIRYSANQTTGFLCNSTLGVGCIRDGTHELTVLHHYGTVAYNTNNTADTMIGIIFIYAIIGQRHNTVHIYVFDGKSVTCTRLSRGYEDTKIVQVVFIFTSKIIGHVNKGKILNGSISTNTTKEALIPATNSHFVVGNHVALTVKVTLEDDIAVDGIPGGAVQIHVNIQVNGNAFKRVQTIFTVCGIVSNSVLYPTKQLLGSGNVDLGSIGLTDIFPEFLIRTLRGIVL
ncbi:MAG: hypothetical protein IJX28_04550 [Clostridia bacterium]|nr:hypothetical protein [Clostridia bacterium]